MVDDMREVELRARVPDVSKLVCLLYNLGFRLESTVSIRDAYYKETGTDVRSFILRVRDMDDVGVLTFKMGSEGCWNEHETRVRDIDEMRWILDAVPVLEKFLEVDKVRMVYRYMGGSGAMPKMRFIVDYVIGRGVWIEVEDIVPAVADMTAVEQRLREKLLVLGIEKESITKDGYVKIFLEEDRNGKSE